MDDGVQNKLDVDRSWLRIPNGTKVRHRLEGYEGVIDGLTELVAKGSPLNPDKRTQYRIEVGAPKVRLAPDEELLIVADADGMMIIGKGNADYRRGVTKRFRAQFADDKFVA